jgi:hypothetical protein
MDLENYETMNMPSRDEGKRYLKTLGERGILTANFDDLQTRMKLVELGLTMPKEKDGWLFFPCCPERAVYIFLRFPDPFRNPGRPRLIAFRFDIAKYMSNPLTPGLEAGPASTLFDRSVTVLARLDSTKCAMGKTWGLN